MLSAGLGLALIGLGVPRALGAWQALGAESTLDKAQAHAMITDEELAGAVAHLKGALDWVETDRWLRDLGLLELTQAQRLYRADPNRAQLLEAAGRHLKAALSLNPLDGMAWVRLAEARELGRALRRDVAVALMGALDAAPFDRGMWLWRSSKLVVYLAELTPEERSAFEGNLRTTWAADRPLVEQLSQFAVYAGALDFVAAALGSDPEATAMIDRVTAEADGTRPK